MEARLLILLSIIFIETTGEPLYANNLETRLNAFEGELMETKDDLTNTKERLTKTEMINKELWARLTESEWKNKEIWDLIKTNEANNRKLELKYQIAKDSFNSELLDVKHRLAITENELNLFKSTSTINHIKTKEGKLCDEVTRDYKPRDINSNNYTNPHDNKPRDVETRVTEESVVVLHDIDKRDLDQENIEKESTNSRKINIDYNSTHLQQNPVHYKPKNIYSIITEHNSTKNSNIDVNTKISVHVNNKNLHVNTEITIPVKNKNSSVIIEKPVTVKRNETKRSFNIPRGENFFMWNLWFKFIKKKFLYYSSSYSKWHLHRVVRGPIDIVVTIPTSTN